MTRAFGRQVDHAMKAGVRSTVKDANEDAAFAMCHLDESANRECPVRRRHLLGAEGRTIRYESVFPIDRRNALFGKGSRDETASDKASGDENKNDQPYEK